MRPWYRPLLALVAGLALSGAACSTPAGPAVPAAGTDQGPVQPKVARLVVAMPQPAREANNPSRDLSPPDIVQLRPIYEQLIQISTKDGKFEPMLATEWNLEPNGRGYRFKLRKGVQFHDGYGEMTAKDVAFTMADLSSTESIHSNAADHRNLLESVDEVNDYEIVFNFKRPDAAWIGNISMQLSGMEIHSKKHMEQKGNPTLSDRPVPGTGAYQFRERQQGTYLRFDRVSFPHWRVQPDFPELEIRWVGEASTRLAALLANEIQMAPLPNDLQPQALNQGMKLATGTVKGVRFFLRFRGVYLNDPKDPSKGYKYPDSPMMDLKVRRALNKAINRDELNKTLLAGKGELLINNHFHPLFRKGWNPDWEKRFPEEYGYDQAKARALLQEAGYGPGKPLATNIMMTNLAELPNVLDVLEAVGNYWRQVGVTVNLVTVDRAEETRRNNNQEFNNHVSPWVAPSDQFLGAFIFNTYTNRPLSGDVVYTPEVDEAFQRVRAELDEKKQDQLWKEYGDIQFRNVQQIPMFYLPVEMVYNAKIVSEYVFPGSISGLYTHLETVKAAR